MSEPRAHTALTAPPVPEAAAEPYGSVVEHAPAWEAWVRETFIAEGAPLENPDHAHLRAADIAVVFANDVCRSKGRTVIGRCALGEPQGSDAWAKAMKADHLARLCGRVPDFLVTLSGLYVSEALARGDAASVCALTEHELYHASQAVSAFGAPRFTAEGRPVWRMRGHDVEEFVGVVRRYGADAAHARAFADAATAEPEVAPAALEGICGTCGASL